jgi:REP element-mobilizing transposase RayT
MKTKTRQRKFGFTNWGGKRRGAGRKPKGEHAGVSHAKRPKLCARHPVLVTMRLRPGLRSLRCNDTHRLVRGALEASSELERFRVVEYSVQSNHLHLMVEATDTRHLRAGASGLVIAFAKRLAALLGWPRGNGRVWGERYHSRELGSPREVRNALSYVFNNFKKHGAITHGDGIVDRYSSAPSFAHRHVPPALAVPIPETAAPDPPPWRPDRPRTWLLATGWTDHHGPLNTNERPA